MNTLIKNWQFKHNWVWFSWRCKIFQHQHHIHQNDHHISSKWSSHQRYSLISIPTPSLWSYFRITMIKKVIKIFIKMTTIICMKILIKIISNYENIDQNVWKGTLWSRSHCTGRQQPWSSVFSSASSCSLPSTKVCHHYDYDDNNYIDGHDHDNHLCLLQKFVSIMIMIWI